LIGFGARDYWQACKQHGQGTGVVTTAVAQSVVGKTNGGTTDRCTHCATAALIVLIGALIALTGAHTVLQVHSLHWHPLCYRCTHCADRCTHCAIGALIALMGHTLCYQVTHCAHRCTHCVPGALIALTGAHATRCPHSAARCFMHPHFPGLHPNKAWLSGGQQYSEGLSREG